jgi:tetratricopeptide (TPR) repeat protein
MRPFIQAIFFIILMAFYSFTFANPTVLGENLKIGRLQFETSTQSPLAKAHFILGVKFLHNFMYPLALREFKLAQSLDPQFALSYWGQAMCYKWSLWSYENKQKGSKVMHDLHALQHVKMTSLEKGLLAAVAEIYQPGSDLENEKKYLAAMQKLYEQFPRNPDVISFYALAMIGYAMDAPYDNNGTALLEKARRLLKSFITVYPAHPGIIHYYMHVNDIPNSPYPREGLIVINNVYQYLSDSSHVLHMPAHLYTALGMWPEAAHANFLSVQASHHLCHFLEKEKIYVPAVDSNDISDTNSLTNKTNVWTSAEWDACDADNVYHSLEWLHYDYLQMGQIEKARALLKEMLKVATVENRDIYDFWADRMLARQILYTQSYQPVTALPKPLIETSKDKNWAAYSECGLLLADGVSAVKYKQMDYLSLIHARYNKIISQLTLPASEEYKDACLLAQAEVSAYKHAYIENNFDSCSHDLDNIQKIQEKLQSSHESLTLPFVSAQEVYGEIMMQKPKYWAKIVDLYEDELKYTPNRTMAIQGLADVKAKLAHSLAH